MAFTSFSELVFDGERIDEQQVFEIPSAPDWEKVLDYSINNYLFYQSPLYLRQETKKLKDIFNAGQINSDKIVMSCGSSVSAASLALAYSLINDDYIPKIYIGSWTEFGKK